MTDKEMAELGMKLELGRYEAYRKDLRRVSIMLRIVIVGMFIAGPAALAFYGNWLAYVMSIFVSVFAFLSYGTFEGWINQRYFAKSPLGYGYNYCGFNCDDSML